MNKHFNYRLVNNGFITFGPSNKLFRESNYTRLDEIGIDVYQGYTYKSNLTTKGLNLVINPCFRIIRQLNAWQEYQRHLKETGREEDERFFKKKQAICVYNKKTIIIDGMEEGLNL